MLHTRNNVSKKMDSILKTSEEKFRGLIENSIDGIIITDASGNIETCNKAMECITGFKSSEVVGFPLCEVYLRLLPVNLRTPELLNNLRTLIQDILELRIDWNGRSQEYSIISMDGVSKVVQANSFLTKTSTSVMLGTIVRDITEWKNHEQKIIEMSFHDHLTGLYNRRFLEEELKRFTDTRNLPLSILIIDVDDFKIINDTYGHFQGDLQLKKIAKILTKVCRNDDIIARMGGDEFTILLPSTTNEDAKGIAARIMEQCKKARKIPLSLSIGISTKTKATQKIMDIMKEADDLMYKVKKRNKKNSTFQP